MVSSQNEASKPSKRPSVKPAKTKSSSKKTTKKAKSKTLSRVPMVGIGASAGGLEAFEEFFDVMPVDSGFAFVVVQHLSPNFESMMDELLSRHSTMDIERIIDDLPVKPNTIYLNTPRSHMIVENGRFRLLSSIDTLGLNLPIDIFFKSMVQEYGQAAIAIVLSGTGSDGTKGAADVRQFEGTVLVQAPENAKFDGMPRSVIASGNFDAIALPHEMPELIKMVKDGKPITQSYSGEMLDDPAAFIFHRLRDKYGTDFGYYKDATIRRRFERRAQLCSLKLEDYARRLETDGEELEQLYADLLIDFTSFFRDTKAFNSVRKIAIEKLAQQMTTENQIRIWVAGCSSGEEAYSIAISFAEYARENNLPLNLKILATDVHQRSLGAAAEGLYPESSLKGLDDDTVARYFEKSIDCYQVNQDIRRLVVFSKHNLLRDPPFTRLDMVSCRNVIIYFKEEAQQKTLTFFHFGLKVDGFLFLGSSESPGHLADEFEILDARWKIYKKRRDVRLIGANTFLSRESTQRSIKVLESSYLKPRKQTRSKQAYEDALEVMLKKFAPPGFLLNGKGEIAHVFGDAGKFINVGGGAFSNRIVDLVNPALHLAITAGLERLIASDKVVFERKVMFAGEKGNRSESIIVGLTKLSKAGRGNEQYLLTLVSPSSNTPPSLDEVKFLDTGESSQILQGHIRDLERDLAATEESLQSLIEELQTSNEELQATNEELMASNEELQSTNEELHSVNEELYTVSTEHQRKIDELTVLSDDMKLLMQATNIGIIFLGANSNIRRFTPSATEAFNLLDQDIGRPFAHTTYKFSDIDVLQIINDVRESKVASTHEILVEDKDFILRVLPYETSSKKFSGIVITLVDVTLIKEGERARIAQKEIYETVLKDLPDPIMRMNLLDGTIVTCNDAFATGQGKTRDEIVGKKFKNVVTRSFARQTMAEIKGAKTNDIIESQVKTKEKHKLKTIMNRRMRIIGDDNGRAVAMQFTGNDITGEYRYMLALETMINIEAMAADDTQRALQTILEIGCEYLGVASGTIARIEDDKFIFESVNGDVFNGSKPGDILPLPRTIAYLIPKGNSIVSFSSLADSNLKNDLRSELLDTECYIGTRTRMPENKSGVLQFMDSQPRDKKFTDMEETMVRLLAQAVGFIHDRGERLASLALRQTELENVNEGLSRFTYLASHDLQEPLRKIQQSGEMLQDDFGDRLDEDGKYFIQIMTSSASRMRSLIEDLLLYSTSVNLDLEKEIVAISTIIDSALEDLKLKIEDTKADIKVGKLPVVACDSKVVKQVIINIVSNSLKYHKNGITPKIQIKSRRRKKSTLIIFKDNGIGMDVKHNVDIFEPFVRLHAKSDYDGSGIGLAICKSVCERHGWKISYKSELDKGTEVHIEIPNEMIA